MSTGKLVRDARAFAILGVESSASSLDVRSAYLLKVRETHPDTNHSIDAKALFQEVLQKKSILLLSYKIYV
jgi:curved DNA-binding protein CbpA